jgi:hypothetical protein
MTTDEALQRAIVALEVLLTAYLELKPESHDYYSEQAHEALYFLKDIDYAKKKEQTS